MDTAFNIITIMILAYFFALNTFYILLTLLSMYGIYSHRNLTAYVNYKKLFHLPLVKPISIIAPAFNEEATIVEKTWSPCCLWNTPSSRSSWSMTGPPTPPWTSWSGPSTSS
jgi:cellulose synthase/poly-beta-1,6-N-acetylglucosamine synthase-like glycosyltransferase